MSCSPDNLIARWRDDADTLRRRGASHQAEALESCAKELEAGLREHELEALTLKEAAAESGYTPDHLGRLIREGRLPKIGAPGSPRIRRADLPRKTGAVESVDGLAERLL